MTSERAALLADLECLCEPMLAMLDNWGVVPSADQVEAMASPFIEEILRLRTVLNRPPVHLVKLTGSGWTIQHPPSCDDMFGCEFTVLAEMWETNPAGRNGVFVMYADGTVSDDEWEAQ